MNLFFIVESHNRLIRQMDRGIFPVDLSIKIKLYKKPHFNNMLRQTLSTYQSTIDEGISLSFSEISALARCIVNSQYFCDGNHRTALLLCYHLALYHNNQLLRIKPYLLYAAIDFEYLKSQSDLNVSYGNFFEVNAIEVALTSRAIGPVHANALKDEQLRLKIDSLRNMPALIESLAEKFNTHTMSASSKDQCKLFRQFLGFRPSMEHSTQVDKTAYLNSLTKRGLRNQFFNPVLEDACQGAEQEHQNLLNGSQL